MRSGYVERYLLTVIAAAALASGIGHYSARVTGTTVGMVAAAFEAVDRDEAVSDADPEIPAFPYVVPGEAR